jgi:hypothetical protein
MDCSDRVNGRLCRVNAEAGPYLLESGRMGDDHEKRRTLPPLPQVVVSPAAQQLVVPWGWAGKVAVLHENQPLVS